jgi:hypothetical protein
MQALLAGLDNQLKSMGQKGITKKEALMIFNAAQQVRPNPSHRDSYSSLHCSVLLSSFDAISLWCI